MGLHAQAVRMAVWPCIPMPDDMAYVFKAKTILRAFYAAVFRFKKTKSKTSACSEIL